MQSRILASLLLVTRLCLAQQFPPYVQFQGGHVPAPTRGISPEVRQTLQEADTTPNASHTVRLRSPGNGDWDWTLQLSDVSVPGISNSTSNAHVAFTTWHFSRTGEEPTPDKRDEDSPVCAYLMDINFPYNVSSQWDPDDSSCIPALGQSCASALSSAYITDNCDSDNAPIAIGLDQCEGMLTGGPATNFYGTVTQGVRFNASEVDDGAWAYALTAPYEGGNKTTYQAAEERLRIMVLSGPDGSDAFCNRVARTVEIGAEEESDSGSEGGSGSGDGQGDGSGRGSGSGGSEGDNEDDESSAAVIAPHHIGGLVLAAAGGLAVCFL